MHLQLVFKTEDSSSQTRPKTECCIIKSHVCLYRYHVDTSKRLILAFIWSSADHILHVSHVIRLGFGPLEEMGDSQITEFISGLYVICCGCICSLKTGVTKNNRIPLLSLS